MSLFTRLLHRCPKFFTLPAELYAPLQALTEEEGLSPGELVTRCVAEGMKQRQDAESLPGRWMSLIPREQQVVALACRNLSNGEIVEAIEIVSKEHGVIF